MTTAYAFQSEDMRTVHRKFGGRGLISWEMGLGKSFGAALYASRYLPRPHDPIVVICPAHLKVNWQREIYKHVPGARVHVLYGRVVPPERRNPPRTRDRWFVLNYDIVQAVQGRDHPHRKHSWGNFLRDLRPELVVIDEGQYLRNPLSKRTKLVKEFVKGVPNLLVLSGTGCMENRPAEMWPCLNMLRPDVFNSLPAFGQRFCQPKWTPWGIKYPGAENLDELNELLLNTCMVRRRAADVLDDLPPLTRSVVPLEIDHRQEYDKAALDFLKWLMNKSPMLARRAAAAENLTRMTYLKRLVGELKVGRVMDWVEDVLEAGEKLILFGHHVETLGRIHRAFKGEAVLVNGTLTKHQRQENFDRFNDSEGCRLLVGNLGAAGTGWSCYSTNRVAFCEYDWSPGIHKQAEKRIHGIERGLKGVTATSHWLVAYDTIEDYLCQLIEEKQGNMDQILDGGSPEGDLLDIHKQVQAKLFERYGLRAPAGR